MIILWTIANHILDILIDFKIQIFKFDLIMCMSGLEPLFQPISL